MFNSNLCFQGITGGSRTHAGMEHSRGTSGPGARTLAELPSCQQILALRPRLHLHPVDARLHDRQWNRHLDI